MFILVLFRSPGKQIKEAKLSDWPCIFFSFFFFFFSLFICLLVCYCYPYFVLLTNVGWFRAHGVLIHNDKANLATINGFNPNRTVETEYSQKFQELKSNYKFSRQKCSVYVKRLQNQTLDNGIQQVHIL